MENTTMAHVAVMELEDNPFYEVVDETIVEQMPLSAYELWIAAVLTFYLGDLLKQHPLGRAVQEMLFDLRASVQRMRRPDVAFVSYDRWPWQKRIPRTQAWDVVPELAVEMISPSDRGDDIVDKVAEYFRAGVRSVWVIMLEILGCDVTVVADGCDALEKVMQQEYDLVFMDCQMAEMDGFTATQAMRQWEAQNARRPLTIVALTANAMKGDRERCLAAGMHDYLSKPFTLASLQMLLERWLPGRMVSSQATR